MTTDSCQLSVLCYGSIASTQDEARCLLARGRDDVVGVRADYQSAGRGRSGHSWTAPAGTCLLVTYIVKGSAVRPGRVARLAFAAGIAVADSLEALTGLAPGLKWPNDVLLRGRKVAGILVETAPSAGGIAALVGIGVNVNLALFPSELAGAATSLTIETGRQYHIGAVEALVRERLFGEIRQLSASGLPSLLERWRQRDVTPGICFLADVDGRHVRGRAVGVSDTGALILESESGERAEVVSATSLTELGS